ncbi:MAG: response regulator [Candidatus Latescibacteria bacterium]|nr:response regulator [Candidatus Latescibacterota bacterium]MBT4138216.1 response regulator [Candidatus Latescibacterota bacterium]MBT5828939.1 response regulator [Candidatus Latescibacterota bacterium]
MIRVLVIDDDVYMRELICYVLEDTPYVVDAAGSGKQGLLRQRSFPADVVITDMGLPDCDGLDVIWAIRSKYPDTHILSARIGVALRDGRGLYL